MTDFIGVRELGLVAGGGILLCVLSTVVVLPPLILLVDRRWPLVTLPTILPAGRWFEFPLRWPRADDGPDAGCRCGGRGRRHRICATTTTCSTCSRGTWKVPTSSGSCSRGSTTACGSRVSICTSRDELHSAQGRVRAAADRGQDRRDRLAAARRRRPQHAARSKRSAGSLRDCPSDRRQRSGRSAAAEAGDRAGPGAAGPRNCHTKRPPRLSSLSFGRRWLPRRPTEVWPPVSRKRQLRLGQRSVAQLAPLRDLADPRRRSWTICPTS